MNAIVRRKRVVVAVTMLLLLPMLTVFSQSIGLDIVPQASAASDCKLDGDVAPAWNVTVEKEVLSGGGYWGHEDWGDDDEFNRQNNLQSLQDSFHTSILMGNDSAVGLRMNMTTGYKYTFCVNFQPVSGEPNQNVPIADVYLIQEYDHTMYVTDFDTRHNDMEGFREDIAHSAPWIQNALLWHPFRDVHAYEGVDEVEFAVALDHEEASWDLWSNEKSPRTMYLYIDAWNNIRDYDTGAPNRNFTVDVTVMIEERFSLPNWTVAIVCCGSLMGILAAPFLVHVKYMKAGAPENETSTLMRHLETEAEQGVAQIAPSGLNSEPPPQT